ncbi:ABC transporter permease [Actinomadura sp. 9N407]|uniref:ABC transporter permease n=1 Tax=Actinomadura sp. 9N407 TaxID=3375154 RepID=UPI0037ACD393
MTTAPPAAVPDLTVLARSLRAEWTKLRTLPSTAWLLLGIAALTVAISAAAAAPVDTGPCPTPAQCYEDTVELSLSGVRLGQALAVVLAVLTISGEFGGGTIRATLAAQPRRLTVLLAKAAVLAAAVAAAGTLGVLGSLAAGRAILPGNGFTEANGYPAASLMDGPTLRAATGTVLYLVLVALLSMGVATAVRDTAGSITAVLALLYASPIVTMLVTDPEWRERVQKLMPMDAGLAVQATTQLDRLPIGPWAGLGVLAAYTAGALLLGGALFKLRDQ